MFYPSATAFRGILRATPIAFSQTGKVNGRSVSGRIFSVQLNNSRDYSSFLAKNQAKVQVKYCEKCKIVKVGNFIFQFSFFVSRYIGPKCNLEIRLINWKIEA